MGCPSPRSSLGGALREGAQGSTRGACTPENSAVRQRQKSGYQCCYQIFTEYLSTTLPFWIREARPWGDSGFQIRDLQVAYRFNAITFTASTTQ